jgi:hypothetical protein
MSVAVDMLRERMRPAVAAQIPQPIRGSSAFRLMALQQGLQGLGLAARARPPPPELPRFRAGRVGHATMHLGLDQRTRIAAAVAQSLGQRALLLVPPLGPGSIDPSAQQFNIRTSFGGHTRSTAALDRSARTRGESCSSCFLLPPAVPFDWAVNQHRRPVVGEIQHFLRIRFIGAHGRLGLPDSLALVNVFDCPITGLTPSGPPTFGYRAFDVRTFTQRFLLPAYLAQPVGVVPSPRLGAPNHLFWVIETHTARSTQYTDL